ncbi:MAG TPA: VWA domain-containing protein [Polyangiaceae bacterium]|jgi:hypothetical protein
MELTGLPLSQLLALGGALGAATLLLYVLKLRRRPVAVPFARIWQRVLRDRESTTLWSRLRRILSFLLQLLLLALLLGALGDPRSIATRGEGRHWVVLVDTSASMKATDVEPSRLGRAKDEALAMIQGLGGSERMLLAGMGATPTPLTTMTADRAELETALSKLEASDTRADVAAGFEFARDSLRGRNAPGIVLLSDGAFGDLEALKARVDLAGIELSYVPVGESGNNVAVTEFSVRRYPLDTSRYEVLLEITNLTDKAQKVELSLLGDGLVTDVSRLELKPNERLPRFYSELSGASERLEARIRLLEGADALDADNHAYALMPERRRARVLVVTPGNTYLEAALLLDEYLDVAVVHPKAYPPAGRFDVTIFDGVAPSAAETGGALLYLDPPETGSPVKRGKRIEGFGFDTWDKKSPLLRWMAMGDIQVAHGHALVPEKTDRVVGASELGPLLVSGTRDGRPFIALGFDARNSDFVLRVAWPLFLLNSINSFVEADTSYLSSYRTGEVWQIPVSVEATSVTLRDPDGRRRRAVVRDGRAVFMGDRAGFYRVDAGAQGAGQGAFAANLVDLEESRIAPNKKGLFGRAPQAEAPRGGGRVRFDPWLVLLLGAIGLSVLEWVTYHRRVTV